PRGPAGDHARGAVERAPPGVDRSQATAVRGPVLSQDLGGAGRGDEVVGDRAGVIGGVLAGLRERYGPSATLRGLIEFRIAGRGEDVAGDVGDRAVGGE